MKARNATGLYKMRQSRIKAQIETIERKLEKHASEFDNKSYAAAGDLGHVSQQLQEIIDFLGTE